MTISMYQASVPVFIRMLNNLVGILEKAAAYAEARKIDPTVLINSRLYPDMFPLSRQVQIVTDTAKGCAARLAGMEPGWEDARVGGRVARGISGAVSPGCGRRWHGGSVREGGAAEDDRGVRLQPALPEEVVHGVVDLEEDRELFALLELHVRGRHQLLHAEHERPLARFFGMQ